MFRSLMLLAVVSAFLMPDVISGQMVFDKVEARANYMGAEEGDKGKLSVGVDRIRFLKDNEREEYFSIPSSSVEELFYSRVAGRRIKTAILVSPLLLFSKGKKHYLTMSFDDGGTQVGAVEFRLDKKNYRGVLRALEQVAGVTVKFDQEGVKAEEEGFAEAEGAGAERDGSGVAPDQGLATLEITSEPEGAEIEINGEFAGMTPRNKQVEPGEYEVVITKQGYRPWSRSFEVGPGEEFPIAVQLEPDE